MNRRGKQILGAVIALIVIATCVLIVRISAKDKEPDSVASDVTSTSAIPTPEPSPKIPEGCPTSPSEIRNPTSMTLIGHDKDMKMITQGRDANGDAPAAPPGNEGYTVGWFNESPVIGSKVGRAVLTSHTFQHGGALGNELNDGLLHEGDVIKITGANGSAACYRYARVSHILVKDYDPDSTLLYDYTGAAEIGIVVCSDYTLKGVAEGRMIYFGELITDDPATTTN